jgi:hypothetical protein
MNDDGELRAQAAQRLFQLREELANAERLERELTLQRARLQERRLRVSGAIEVLDAMLAEPAAS